MLKTRKKKKYLGTYLLNVTFASQFNSFEVCLYIWKYWKTRTQILISWICLLCSVRRQHLFLATARVRSEISFCSWHFGNNIIQKAEFLIYVWNTVAGLIIECLITHYSAFLSHSQVHWGSVGTDLEDSFWKLSSSSHIPLSSITLSPPPSSLS